MIKEFKDIDALSYSDFEIFVKDVFEASGWTNSEITKSGREFKHGDGGVDIFSYKGNRKFAIEVKQRNINTTVDIKALNQLVTGARLANVTNMILVTNSYFTSEVKVRALRLGVELINREELQNLWIMKHSEIGRDIKPRKYQQDVIDEAISQYTNGKTKILIEMATGLGKTYTAAHLTKRLIKKSPKRPRVLFIAHQVEILLQSVTSFKNVLGIGNYSFSACFSGSNPEETDFVFASFDTLYGQIKNLKKSHFDYVIIDEAHHTPARTYSEVASVFSPRFLIGLTATPYRSDRKDVLSFFGGADGHIGKYDLVWALKHKKLAFPKYLVLLDDLDDQKINQLQCGLSIADIDKRLFLHKKDKEVVRIIEKTVTEQNIDNPKGIIFCRNIRHMKHLIGFFALGTATLVHSKMTDQERRENIRNFREGDFKYILVCDLFNEGVDIPETNLLVFMRHTGSHTIWLQQLGRGLRKTPNKDYVYVLDFVGSLERLNEVRELSRKIERQKIEQQNLTDETDETDKTGNAAVFHDGSIEVKYSKEAAKVLALIESLKMQLNSRENLLEGIRAYFKENNKIPEISRIEESIPNLSLDQLATHFGSYHNYIRTAFEDNLLSQPAIQAKIKKYISNYRDKYGIIPSYRAVSQNFMEGPLCEFEDKEIKEVIEKTSTLNPASSNDEPEKISINKKIKTSEETCPLVEKYLDTIFTRGDIKSLTHEDKDKISEKYISTSIFLKKLKDARKK